MTDPVKSWIEERRAIHTKATEEPWEAGDGWVFTDPIYPDDNRLCDVFGMSFSDTERQSDERARGQLNTEAIVDAHNMFPRALDALERVLELHKPIESIDGDNLCSTCAEEDNCTVAMYWPCPTVQAIEGAINE